VRFALDDPRWLLLLIPAIASIAVALRWFGTMAVPRRWSVALFRLALFAAISTLLAGASSIRSTNRLAVIAVIDTSQSVRLFGDVPATPSRPAQSAIDSARAFLAASTRSRGPEDLLGIVCFDGRSITIAAPTTADIASRSIEVPIVSGTDIAGALRDAAALVPPDAAARLVLFSDGNETSGDALAAARQLSTQGAANSRRALPIDAVPITLHAEREVLIESLDAPPRAGAQATINLRVTLRATSPASGTLRVLLNEKPAAPPKRLSLSPGASVEIVPVALPPGRVHNFRAVYEPDTETLADGSVRAIADTRTENNSAEAFTLTPGRGSILIVDPDATGANSQTLAGALRQSNLDVSIVAPSGIPGSSLDLQAYDLLIFNNIPAELVPEATQHAIETAVKDLGLGFVMVGGPDSFGAGAWKGTPIEAMLPVQLDLPEQLVQPDAAVMLVIDNSGSMSRGVMGAAASKQEIANQSAALAIRSLDSKDLVGVIVFNNTYDVLIPLAANTNPKAAGERVLSITAGGGTVALPALTEARRQLAGVKASVKHIILLSDGVSENRDALPDLAERMWREDKIMVTSIGIGDEMDEQTMGAIAQRGGGQFYPVTNPQLLPRFLLKAIRVVRSPLIRLGSFTPVVTAAGSPLTIGLAPLPPPPLTGIVLTQARPEPTITYAMRHPQGEPLLAHWVYQLGQVAAFTSDASQWASNWIDWPGYRELWTTIARTISRPQTPGRFEISTSTDANRLTIRLDAAGDDAKPLDRLSVPGTLYPTGSTDSRAVPVMLSQSAPGVYETTTPALAPGNYAITLTPRSGTQRLAPVVGGVSIAPGFELRELTTNMELLRRIASSTGGRVLDLNDPASARLFDRTGIEPRLSRTPLQRALLLLTLVLLMLDIATRRIAWDRLISSEFGETWRDRVRAAIAEKGVQATRAAARLRDASDTAAIPRAASPQVALSDADADRLIEEQRRRRLHARLDAARQRAQPAIAPNSERSPESAGATLPHARDDSGQIPDEPGAAADEGAAGLLAAKRRARRRFEGDDPKP
jgi:uncharacterized membrane protein